MTASPPTLADGDMASPLPLYEQSLQGDPAAYARTAFDWLQAHLAFEAGMLVTSRVGEPAFLDAHFTGFPDLPALMASWQRVAHLDLLAPQLVAQPGVARRHDRDDPALAGPAFAPLHEHLRRFGIEYTLCIALPGAEPKFLTVIILVRSANGQRASAAELARLARIAPRVAETYAACRRMALLRLPAAGLQPLNLARVNAQGAYVQTTASYCELMWAGAAPQNVHVEPAALQALTRGQSWPLPGRGLTLHGQRAPDGDGWLLRLSTSRAADELSPREREIARRFASGASNTDIARALAISPATVRNHLSHVYAKLAVSHRAGLIEALRDTP